MVIQDNEIRITANPKKLIVDVAVEDLSYYTDVYIDSVIIDNQDTYASSGPSSNPLYKITLEARDNLVYSTLNSNTPVLVSEGSYVYITSDGNTKSIRLELSGNDFRSNLGKLDSDLFFVYVTLKGTPAPDTPCGMDGSLAVIVVYDTSRLYAAGMKYFSELEGNCNSRKVLTDYILQTKAIEFAVKTGNYAQAILWWNKFFGILPNTPTLNCNCHA